jgi:Holliday junction resolvase RusA-like endonuclease
MRYKCTNEQCSLFGKEIVIEKMKYIYDEVQKEVVPKEPIICKECGNNLEYIKKDGPIEVMIGRFSSMSQEQKRAAMKKRSQDHFKKTDKGDLANYKKQITDKMRRRALGE